MSNFNEDCCNDDCDCGSWTAADAYIASIFVTTLALIFAGVI